MGRFTTEEEVDYTVEKCVRNVNRLREMRLAMFIKTNSKTFINGFDIFRTYSLHGRI